MARRIAFLGPRGTYTEQALLAYDPSAEPVPFPTITAVGRAVADGRAELGVVPIENSLEGSVNETLDLLIGEALLHIYGEVVIPVEHCLLALPGTSLEEVRVVFSHPQALAQCRGYLDRVLPHARRTASLSTASAVEDMRRSAEPAVAIAPARSAEIYGVEILARGVQDNPNNATRFVVLALHDHDPTGDDKTSLCFSFDEDRPGILYEALGEFARRSINLTRVESRPERSVLGRYIFLVDCQGHRKESPVMEALDGLSRLASRLRVFGSYPRWRGETG